MMALVLATLLAFAPADTTHSPRMAPGACPGGQTLKAEDIGAAGVVYTADLVRLLDTGRMMTVDGFSWHPFMGGGSPFADAPFVVLVDGEPWQADDFGAAMLHTLPVALVDIASVEWCPEAGLVAGQWAGRGTLHIRTIREGPGTTARGAWQIGNETGDPGPYRYTDRGTPNVDKSGPDGEMLFAAVDSTRRGRMTLRTHRFYATDPAMLSRTLAVTTALTSNLRVITAALDGETAILGGRLRGEATGHYDSDLWFFEPSGRELPVRRLQARLGLQGERALGPRTVHARLGLGLRRLSDEQSERPGFDPDWHARTATAHLELRAAPDGWPSALGARLVRTDAAGPGLGSGAGFTLGTAYAQQQWRLGARTVLDTHLAVVGAAGGAGVKARQALRYADALYQLSASIAYDRRLPEEEPDYGYWAGRGYTGLLHEDTPYLAPDRPRTASELSARVAGSAVLGRSVQAHASAGVRSERGLYIERPTFALMPGEIAVTGPVQAEAEARGTSIDARTAIDAAFGVWQARAFYSLRTDVEGSASFQAAWDRVPTHRAGFTLTARPDPGFSLRMAYTAQSGTRWPGYAGVDGIEESRGYVYTDRVPPLSVLDITVEKGVWDRTLRLALVFRNVLNTEERYHPIGAALDYRLFFRLEALLHGLPVWR